MSAAPIKHDVRQSNYRAATPPAAGRHLLGLGKLGRGEFAILNGAKDDTSRTDDHAGDELLVNRRTKRRRHGLKHNGRQCHAKVDACHANGKVKRTSLGGRVAGGKLPSSGT